MITLKQAKEELKPLDITINRNKWGEYRVNFAKGSEMTACYLNSIEEAVATGKVMAAQKNLDMVSDFRYYWISGKKNNE
jgi:hypothetical protein